jgi:multicomponent Na+:H+ antiporter subunit E
VVTEVIMLAGVWLIFSGMLDAFHLSLGAASVAAVMLFNRAVRRLSPARGGPAERAQIRYGSVLLYIPWLLLQIVISAVYVTRVILADPDCINPEVFRFRCDQPNEVAQVTLANSITLTPGTLTLAVDGDEYTVHALDTHSKSGVLTGEMQRRVAKMWGGSGAMLPGSHSEEPG